MGRKADRHSLDVDAGVEDAPAAPEHFQGIRIEYSAIEKRSKAAAVLERVPGAGNARSRHQSGDNAALGGAAA